MGYTKGFVSKIVKYIFVSNSLNKTDKILSGGLISFGRIKIVEEMLSNGGTAFILVVRDSKKNMKGLAIMTDSEHCVFSVHCYQGLAEELIRG